MLKDAEYRALQEQVHLLQELEKQPGWQELTAIAHELMAPVKTKMLNGLAASHDDYLKSAWFCVGIHKVLGLPQIIYDRLEEERKQRVEADVPLT